MPDGSIVRDPGPWTHRDVSANGIRFHIVEAGSGPLVVLLHGFGQYWRSWRYQIPGLAQAGFRVVAPDLRGYGDSDKTPRGYDAFTLADDVAGLVRRLGERDAVLVGHGYGGVTAFDTAVMNPGQVRGVVAIAAPHPIRMARIRRPVAADRYGRLLTWAATPAWPERHLVAGNAALLERHRPVPVRAGLEGVQGLHRDHGEDAAGDPHPGRGPGRGRAPALGGPLAAGAPTGTGTGRRWPRPITAPVLHVVGDADRFTPPSALVDAREQCTGWYTLSTVRGVGHYPAEEAPDTVTRMIAEPGRPRPQPS